jgi:hypothetical protein
MHSPMITTVAETTTSTVVSSSVCREALRFPSH